MSQCPKLTDPVSGKEAPVFLRMLGARNQSPIFIMIGAEEAMPLEPDLTRRLDADARAMLDLMRTRPPGDTMFHFVRRFLMAWMDNQLSGRTPEGDDLEAFRRVVRFIEARFDPLPR